MSFINDIFTAVAEIVGDAADLLTSLFESVVAIFYTPGGAESEGGLTIIGILTLVGVGFTLVMWGFNYIQKLIKFR